MSFKDDVRKIMTKLTGPEMGASIFDMFSDSKEDQIALLKALETFLGKMLGPKKTEELIEQILKKYPELKKNGEHKRNGTPTAA